MLGSAVVQQQIRKPEHGGDKYFIYLPKQIVEELELEKRSIVGFDIQKQGLAKPRKRKMFERRDAVQLNTDELAAVQKLAHVPTEDFNNAIQLFEDQYDGDHFEQILLEVKLKKQMFAKQAGEQNNEPRNE